MAFAVASDSKDQSRGPRLALSVDTPHSSSPFPSPSSSFLPPPMPGAHEFAVKAPPAGRKKSVVGGIGKKDDEPSATAATGENSKESVPSPSLLGFNIEESVLTPTNNPGFQPPSAAATTTSASTATTPTGPSTPLPSSAPSSRHNSLRDSLTSNRPAPPSPAASRRVSAVPSTSSTRSRSSRPGSTRKHSSISQVQASPSPKAQNRRSLLVKVRDFAFGSSDDRHMGLGSDVPRQNRPKRGSMGSTSSQEPDGDGEDEDGEDGWNGFRWGFGRLSSWGFGRGSGTGESGSGRTASGEGKSGYVPTDTDFARNFDSDAGAPAEANDDDSDEGEYVDAEDDEGGDGGGALESEGGPLYPGLYRAMYAFEPEGTAEMALAEEQVVRVVGRGGGVGWAVVVREEGGGHALVPESYLEPVRLDGEDEEESEEGDEEKGQ